MVTLTPPNSHPPQPFFLLGLFPAGINTRQVTETRIKMKIALISGRTPTGSQGRRADQIMYCSGGALLMMDIRDLKLGKTTVEQKILLNLLSSEFTLTHL